MLKTGLEYRARVIQLESFLAKIFLVYNLLPEDQEIAEYVINTSIARTEDYDERIRCTRPWQDVTPLEKEMQKCRERG